MTYDDHLVWPMHVPPRWEPIYHYEAIQGQGPHFPPTRKATIHIHRGSGGRGSRWVHYIGGVWVGFVCGPYSIVKSLISTCVWCIKAQGSIGYLTDCRQSKRHASYPYRSVERQRRSSVVAELFAPWIFTKMSTMMTMSHMRWDKGCSVMEAS